MSKIKTQKTKKIGLKEAVSIGIGGGPPNLNTMSGLLRTNAYDPMVAFHDQVPTYLLQDFADPSRSSAATQVDWLDPNVRPHFFTTLLNNGANRQARIDAVRSFLAAHGEAWPWSAPLTP